MRVKVAMPGTVFTIYSVALPQLQRWRRINFDFDLPPNSKSWESSNSTPDSRCTARRTQSGSSGPSNRGTQSLRYKSSLVKPKATTRTAESVWLLYWKKVWYITQITAMGCLDYFEWLYEYKTTMYIVWSISAFSRMYFQLKWTKWNCYYTLKNGMVSFFRLKASTRAVPYQASALTSTEGNPPFKNWKSLVKPRKSIRALTKIHLDCHQYIVIPATTANK